MRISTLKEIVRRHLNSTTLVDTSIFVEGPSGIGKSEAFEQVADEEGVPLIDVRFSQLDAVDLRGVPFVEAVRKETERCTRWARPGFFPDESTPRGIFLADEITSGMPSVLAAAYQLFLSKGLGDYRFPKGWLLVAAGNPVTSRGVTYQMPAPLLNRFVKLNAEVNLDDFMEWGFANGQDPRMLAFVRTMPQYLYAFNPSAEIQPFPTPRSHVCAAQYYDFAPTERIELVAGCVGTEAGSQIETFMRVWGDLPDMADVVANPENAKVPSTLGGRWAVAVACAEVSTVKTFKNVNIYLSRLPSECSFLAGKLAMKRHPKLHVSEGYKDWAERHGNLLHQT